MSPEIVAEIGPNHAGDLDKALRLIDVAAEAGADTVKFQAFDADELAPPSTARHFRLSSGPWRGRYLHDLYTEAHTPWAWFPALIRRCEDQALGWFASVFGPRGLKRMVDFYGMERIKIASPEVDYPALLHAVYETGLPVVISDGCATNALGDLVDWLEQSSRVTVLRCVSSYPAQPGDYGLADVRHGWLYGTPYWGVSLHTTHPAVATAAVALGACMVEAHLMLDVAAYDRPPLDEGHSLDPDQFTALVESVRIAERVMHSAPQVDEMKLAAGGFMRRMVWARDVAGGARVVEGDMVCMRSSDGLEPLHESMQAGKLLRRDVDQWEPVQQEDFGG